MKSIDFKSLLIGILGTALVMVLMGQSSMQKQYDIECVINEKRNTWVIYKRFILNGEKWNEDFISGNSLMMKVDDLFSNSIGY